MPRTSRMVISDEQAVYHVMSRTALLGYPLKAVENDYLLELIKRFSKLYFAEIIGFCLMGNHFHLLVKMLPEGDFSDKEVKKRCEGFYGKDYVFPQDHLPHIRLKLASLSEFVRDIKVNFTRYYNRRHNRKGYFWGDRFKSVIVDKGETLVNCLAYIDLNPFRDIRFEATFGNDLINLMTSSKNDQFSIIIPVYNETAAINQLLGHLAECFQVIQPEVIVVDGHPQGTTSKAINTRFHSDQVQLKKMISPKSGRAAQMNSGAGIARGRFLMFLHADTILSKQAVGRIPHLIGDKSLTCGAFSLGINHPGRAYRLIETMANLRNRITRLPYGDQAQFFRKDYFDSLGGYADIPLMEDVEIMQRVKKRKDRCRILPEKVFTSARRWEKEGIVYGTLRNWMLISLYSLGVSPKRLAAYYRRHNS